MPSVPLLHRLCSLLHLSVNAMLSAPAVRAAPPPPPPEAPSPPSPWRISPELVALARQLCSLSAGQRRSLMVIAKFLARHPPDPDDEPPQQ